MLPGWGWSPVAGGREGFPLKPPPSPNPRMQRCPGSAYDPLGVCRACRTQGPFSSDRVCGMEKSCPLHFEYMLHGMWWSGSQAFRTHPITLKGKPPRKSCSLEPHFLKTCSVWAIPKLHVSKPGWGVGGSRVHTCVCIHIYVHTCVWGYPSRSYTPFPGAKIAKMKDMATWLEPGDRSKSHSSMPHHRFLSPPPSDTQTQTLQNRQTQC